MSDIRPFYGQGEAVQIREKSEVEQLRDENTRLREQLVLAHRMLLQTNWRDDEEAMGEIRAALDGGKGVKGD